jgi:carlactone C-19 oxidase
VNDELRRMMDGIVADCAAARGELAPASSQQQKQHKDFLSVVLAARDRDESTRELLSPDYLSALTYEHLLAGSPTTAFTLSSVLLYLVAQHPEVEEKLQAKFPYLDQARTYHCTAPLPTIHEEIDTHVPLRTQVVNESMRFFMVSPLVARETSERVEIGGYVLPKVRNMTSLLVEINRG